MKNLRDHTGGAPSGTPRCALAAFAVLFALTSGAGRATAADVSPFQLTDVGGFVELGFFTSIQDRSRTITAGSNFNRVELSQLLNVNARAYVYHPSFLTFQGGLQVEFIEDLLNQVNHRILPGGDFRLNFLQDHRNGLSIFGRVLQTEQMRPFSKVYDVLSQLYGATFYQRWGWVPFGLTYQHRSQASSGSNNLDISAEEILFRGKYELGEESRGSIDYDLVLEDRRGDEIRRQDLTVNNTTYFGDEGEKRLFTNLFFQEEITDRSSGKRKRYSVNGSTYLNWQHTDDLLTQYRLAGRWSDFGRQDLLNLNPSFLVTHELYESLTTQVEVFADLQDGSIGSRNQFGGAISEAYVKQLGGWGRLALRAAPRITMTYDRPKETSAFVVNEEHVMTLAQPVSLLSPNVVEDTIVVTNEDGSITYDPGPTGDYIVNPLDGGFETLLEIAPFSLIGDGERVLVSYVYDLGGRSDILISTVSFNAFLWIFERLGLFGRYEINDQRLLSGNEQEVRLNPFDRSVVGLQLEWPWFSARAEFEDYDAVFAPFRGYSGSLSVFSDRTASWRARCGVGYAFRKYSDTGEDLSRLTSSVAVRKRLFRRGELELNGRYRRVRWSGERAAANDVDALYANVGFSWWYGRINVKLEGGMEQVLRKVEDKRVYRVDLRMRRSF